MTTFVPHPYQIKAIATAVRTKFLALFLDPGLGKTSIILRMFVSLKRNKLTKGMLIVAPLRPCYSVWPQEVKKWTFSRHLTVRILHGNNKLDELRRPADIYVINPEGLKWLFHIALKGKRNYPFDILVVDESGKFKNPDSKRLKILKPKLRKFNRRYILNGTPAPNGAMDLWSQFLIVDKGKTFGSEIKHYRGQFFVPSGYMGHDYKIASPESLQIIYRQAAKIALVMEAKDYLDMPPLTYHDIEVVLSSKARQHYDEIEKELFTVIDSDEFEIVNSAMSSMACRQIANGGLYHSTPEGQRPLPAKRRPWHDIHRAKDEALCNLVDELQHKPLLVAYEFRHDLLRIKQCLKKSFNLTVPHIGSGVSAAEGARLEIAWNAGKLRVLAVHPASAAHGINMQQAGEDILWYSLTYSLEYYVQLIRRIYRQGMKGEHVRVHHLIAIDTVDEAMMSRLGAKAARQSSLKDALKAYREGKR